MFILFEVFLLTLLVLTAVAIVRTENLFAVVMLTGIFSLLMAVNFFVLDAADVALTEAAIGAGITTVFFLSALALTTDRERPIVMGRWISVCAVTLTTLVLIYATFDKPRLGDPNAPVHQHVAPWYLEKTPELIGIPNVVTSVLASFRAYDTLGEVFVVVTAGIGVLFIFSTGGNNPRRMANYASSSTADGLRHHLIPKMVGRLLIPFIVLFGLYVLFHGEYSPGGGFQAGAIMAAGVILYALLEGQSKALAAVPRPVLMGMMFGGALLYGLVGLAGVLLGGNFLDYSVLASDPIKGQQMGILLIEIGVGLAVLGSLLSMFHAFASRGEC